MGLKRADPNATKRFVRGDDKEWVDGDEAAGIAPHPSDAGDDAWVECRVSLSKRDDMTINDASTSERLLDDDGRISLKPAKQKGVDPPVFQLIVHSWSEGEVSAAAYEALDTADADWVDFCIRRAIGIARGAIAGNSDSPGKADPPSSLQNSSDAEASQT